MSDTDSQKSPERNEFGPHQQERRTLAEQSRAGKASLARQGHIPVENPTYGYDYDPLTKVRLVNPAEAEIVREIFGRVIAGQSLTRIAKDLNQRGVPTKRGGPWVGTAVKAVATRTSYCGVDFYGRKRRTVFDSQGHRKSVRVEVPQDGWFRVDGFSPPIISEPTFDSAQRALPARNSVQPRDFTHHSDDDEGARGTK